MKAFLIILLALPLWAEFQAVDLNTASQAQLELLPGVGKKLAEAILDYRAKNGAFSRLEQLEEVDGMRPKLASELKHLVVISSSKKAKMSKAGGASSFDEMKTLIANYPGEPNVQEMQRHVVNFASLSSEMMASMMQRVRYAALLPKMHVGVDRILDKGMSIRERTGDPNTLYTKDSANWQFSAKAEWSLNELIFNPDELRGAHQAVRVSKERESLLVHATESYFARRKVQIVLRFFPPSDPKQMAELFLEEQRYLGDLDALTGGWFSAQLTH